MEKVPTLLELAEQINSIDWPAQGIIYHPDLYDELKSRDALPDGAIRAEYLAEVKPAG